MTFRHVKNAENRIRSQNFFENQLHSTKKFAFGVWIFELLSNFMLRGMQFFTNEKKNV